MAGNPVYGAGYYKGSHDGFGKGAGTGAAVVVVLGGAVYGLKWCYGKFKDNAAAKHEQKLLEDGLSEGSLDEELPEGDSEADPTA